MAAGSCTRRCPRAPIRRASTPMSGCSASPSSRSRRSRRRSRSSSPSCKLRAPGMSLDQMPIFAWYMLVTALMMLVGFPPLILGSILLEIERAFDLPFFDPDARRRPAAVAAPVLAVRAPRGLHHLPARGRRDVDHPARCSRAARCSATRWIVVAHRRHGVPAASGCGCTTCSRSASRIWRWPSFRPPARWWPFPTAVQIFAWIGTLAAGRPQLDCRCCISWVLLRLRLRRADRRDAGDGAVQLAGPRHAFRRRPSALCAGRRLCLSRCWRRSITGCRTSPALAASEPGRYRPSG